MKLPAISISRWAINAEGNLYKIDGYVGIGTDSPSVELDVVGDVRVTGNIINDSLHSALDGYQTQIDNIGLQIDNSLVPLLVACDGYQTQIDLYYLQTKVLTTLRMYNYE